MFVFKKFDYLSICLEAAFGKHDETFIDSFLELCTSHLLKVEFVQVLDYLRSTPLKRCDFADKELSQLHRVIHFRNPHDRQDVSPILLMIE